MDGRRYRHVRNTRPAIGRPIRMRPRACQRNSSWAETTASVLAKLLAQVDSTWIACHAMNPAARRHRSPGGTQLGTDIYISTGATVTYNPNRQLLTGDDGLDRFGDWRIQPNAAFPGTPTLNLSNGSKFEHQTTFGGDIDGMWTRWNGAELNLDGAGTSLVEREMRRMVLRAARSCSLRTMDMQPGADYQHHQWRPFRESRPGVVWHLWQHAQRRDEAGIRVVMTINNGHMDLTGGDEYELDNDNFLTRGDLSFIYDWTHDADPTNDETYVINFTGPGDITVDGEVATPIDVADGTYTPAELAAEFGAGRGGIRIAHQVAVDS